MTYVAYEAYEVYMKPQICESAFRVTFFFRTNKAVYIEKGIEEEKKKNQRDVM